MRSGDYMTSKSAREASSSFQEAELESASETDVKDHFVPQTEINHSEISKSDPEVHNQVVGSHDSVAEQRGVEQQDSSYSAHFHSDDPASNIKPYVPCEPESQVDKPLERSAHQETSDDTSLEASEGVEVTIGHQTVTNQDRPRMSQSLSRTSVVSVAEVPRGLVRASLIMAGNALFMAAAEIIIEVLVLTGLYPKLPFRLDFFFLTLLSGLLGYHAVRGIAKGEFDTSINALQVSAVVEIALLAGDAKFMAEQGSKYAAAIPTRAAFAVLTAVNLILVIYMAIRLLRYHSRQKQYGGG